MCVTGPRAPGSEPWPSGAALMMSTAGALRPQGLTFLQFWRPEVQSAAVEGQAARGPGGGVSLPLCPGGPGAPWLPPHAAVSASSSRGRVAPLLPSLVRLFLTRWPRRPREPWFSCTCRLLPVGHQQPPPLLPVTVCPLRGVAGGLGRALGVVRSWGRSLKSPPLPLPSGCQVALCHLAPQADYAGSSSGSSSPLFTAPCCRH